ncbi:type VII secretion protein EccE [Nocardia paucivorans]|uniref:type VII secretion protein EccE n=1 Tax=Nocardia paucivorans TaxID=114259 RepID=UPI000592DE40|nr:type VII secretion protein EccE [Nocardia paucivorans]
MADPAVAGPGKLFGRISMRNLLVAQLIGLVAGVVVLMMGLGPWVALVAVVVVMAIPLIPVGRRVLLDWLDTWWAYLTRTEYTIGSTVDFRGPDGRSLGLFQDGSRIVSVIEVLAPKGGLTRLDRSTVRASHLLPLPDLARCLTQHDILLSGIDIISHGHRSRSGTPAGAIYESLLGPLPATAHRTVWLAIAFDAVACPGAAERRGGGDEGAKRAVTIATQRIMRTLEDADCTARILTAPEIRRAVLQVTQNNNPRDLTHSWRYAELGNCVNIGDALDPKYLDSEALSQLWVPASLGTTVAVRLRPGHSADTVNIGAAWRLTTRELPEDRKLPGMVSMNGRHRDALLAHLPLALPGLEEVVPMAEHPVEAIGALRLPSAGCGQLIGSDEQGNGVAVRIIGAGIASVYVAGELYFAQQLVFRALAIGERVLVRTDRPHAWAQLVETIGNWERLSIAVETHQSDAGYTATVVDGVIGPAPHAGITTIFVAADPRGWPATPPDLSLQQPGAIGNHIILRTGATRVDLNLVSIPREATYIGHPRGRVPAHQ